MKKSLFILIACLFIISTNDAQITTPAPSPSSKIEQTVGLSTVTVEYSRPSMKGRKIFAADGLVEFGKMWRTGANAATKVTFSEDVTINGKALKKGSYALLTKPEASKWTFYFYPHESSNWSSYTEKEAALTVEAESMQIPASIESFMISFDAFTDSSAKMEFLWESTYVGLDLGVETEKAVMASIERVMAGPSANDYYNAASYYYSSGKDLNKALEWVQKATKVENPRFWQVRREAQILADLGKYNEAIQAAKLSKDLAAAAGNDEYVKMNDASIKEWMAKK